MCLLPFESHFFPILKARGHFRDSSEAWGGLMATGMRSARVLGKVSRATGSGPEDDVALLSLWMNLFIYFY